MSLSTACSKDIPRNAYGNGGDDEGHHQLDQSVPSTRHGHHLAIHALRTMVP